ncbi:PQQ-binding-like beta-propeller repeat protein [Nitriliruptor alkaliphilus]|uniref:outer membrane protein assembly factor BamB family protein n=1 Tax=Nitriliruptor alkaliphilus TaxID=427918 RepID=UPI000697D155|nr:PQQ-binding-like beta-propeller repeat protein [Nitriliruptor alkaliphilus]
MEPRTIVAATVVALVALSACAGASEGARTAVTEVEVEAEPGATDVAPPAPAEPDVTGGEPRPWHLSGSSPDEVLLELTSSGGCTEFVGWVTEETEEAVTVEARWEPADPGGVCRAILLIETHRLALAAPLGDRDLVGCHRADCRAVPSFEDDPAVGAGGAAGSVVTDGGSVVVDDGQHRWGFTLDGEPTWQAPGGGWPELGGSVLVEHDFQRTVTATDVRTGERIWQLDGVTRGPVVGDLVIVCPPEQIDLPPPHEAFVAAVSLADGTERWRVEDEACFTDSYATDGEVIAAVDLGRGGDDDLEADGVMVIRDLADGGVRHEVPLGSNAVPVGPVAFDGGFAVAEHDGGALLLVDAAGTLTRHADVPGYVVGAVGTVLLVQQRETLVAVDAADGTERWREPSPSGVSAPFAADGTTLLRTGRDAVERLDPTDGSVRWRAAIGRSPRVAFAEHGGVVYLATSTALLALDADTGARHWWAPLDAP